MKVIGISGSPRRGGNSDILLGHVLKGAASAGADVEKLYICGLDFVPCQECRNIRRDGKCLIRDGMDIVYAKINSADAVVVASPVFFGSVTAQLKAMIDRFQCVWMAKNAPGGKCLPGRKKMGYFLCVSAAARKDFYLNSRAVIRNFFATIGAAYKGGIFVYGVEQKGEIKMLPATLDAALKMGADIAKNGSAKKRKTTVAQKKRKTLAVR
jgi:multimeric flavodoxin WrbA